MLGKTRIIAAIVIVVGGLTFAKYFSAQLEPIVVRLCAPGHMSSALAAVALDRKYFRTEGLDLVFRTAEYGRQCLDFLNNGEIDLAIAYVPAVMNAIQKGNKLVVVSEVHSSSENSAVVFPKGTMRSPSDLVGKKVAVTKGTNSHGLFSMFMIAHELPESSLKLVDLRLKEMASALEREEVDAVAINEPHLSQLLQTGRYSTFESSFYTEFSLLVKKQSPSPQVEAAIPKVIRALMRGEELIGSNPEATRLITAQVFGLDPDLITRESWSHYQFRLRLSSVAEAMMRLVPTQFYALPALTADEVAQYINARYLDEAVPGLVTYR